MASQVDGVDIGTRGEGEREKWAKWVRGWQEEHEGSRKTSDAKFHVYK